MASCEAGRPPQLAASIFFLKTLATAIKNIEAQRRPVLT
jgi:hypothetical protein